METGGSGSEGGRAVKYEIRMRQFSRVHASRFVHMQGSKVSLIPQEGKKKFAAGARRAAGELMSRFVLGTPSSTAYTYGYVPADDDRSRL